MKEFNARVYVQTKGTNYYQHIMNLSFDDFNDVHINAENIENILFELLEG